jgi:hypothetical protein
LVRDINADLQARVVDINRALLSRDLGGDANGEEEEATIKREGYAGSYMASKEALIEIPVSLADAIGGPEAVRAAAEMRREEQSRDNEGPQEGRERRPEEGRERGAGGGGEAAERTRRDTEAAAERTRGEQEAATERALRQREEETERAIRERDEATARAIEETRKADLDHAESLRAAHEKVQTIIGLIRAHGNNPLPTALIGAAEVLRRSILEHGEEALALQEAIAEHQAAAREALEIHEADNTLHDSAHEVQAEAQHRLDEAGEAHGPVSHSLGGYGELVEAAAAHAGYSAPHYADLHYGTSKFSTAKHPPKGEYAETEYPEKAEYAESEYPEKAEFGETPAGPGSEESQKAHAEALERQQEGPQEGAGTAEPREAVSYSEAPENRVTQAPDIEAQQEQKAEQAREVLGAMQEERERDEERERQQERQHEDQREQEKKIREDAEKQSEERWERQDGREARVNEAAEVRQEAEDDRESRRDVILEHMAHLSNLPADAVGLRAMAGAGGTAAVQPFPEHAHPGGVYTPLQAAAGRSMPRAAPRAATVQAMTGGAAMLRGAPGLDAAKNFRTAANINTHWPGEWAPLGKTQFALGNFHAMPGINYKALGAVAAAQWPGAVPPKNDPVGKATKAILENNEASPRKNAKMKEPNFGHSFGDLLTPQEKPAPAPGPAPEPSAEG